MTAHQADGALRPRGPYGRLRQAWVDLSLQTRLLMFALALVTLPGVAFALFAFSGARAALEREVGMRLRQTAERGTEAVAAAFAGAQSDARSWARQDVMRELLVGDVDKRVSRFLDAVADDDAAYLQALCLDRQGMVVAASSGDWIGRTFRARTAATEMLVGPAASDEFGRAIVEIRVPIANPDPPAGQIGTLVLIYDWSGIRGLLDAMRVKLASPEKRVAAMVIDRAGNPIGGVAFGGEPAERSSLARAAWAVGPQGYGERTIELAGHRPVEVLVGAAGMPQPAQGWSVLFAEPTAEALAAVGKVRARWMLMIGSILLVGLAVAILLARQVMRPLNEVTRATSAVAARPDLELPLLPVRSRNEVGRLTEAFNKMTTELKRSQEEALSAAKFAFAGELAAMIAHEIRTPLTVMRSSAQILADPAPPSAHHAELAATIVAEVDRVERVVTGLIELARPLEQRLEPTRLGDVLSRAADFAAAHARRREIRIACAAAGDERAALCDPEQIYQVALNLLVNALQALPPGGTVRLSTLGEISGTVGFEVADDGPGLPQEISGRIFQPFVTGRAGGTGLGLAFVERIVKAHRGSVSVQSREGEGTVFQVRLPAAEVAA